MKFKDAWNWFDWNLYLFMQRLTDDEEQSLPDKIRIALQKHYHIQMLMVMFWSFAFAIAVMYENMSMATLGYIPLSQIQLLPIYVWLIQIFIVLYVGLRLEKMIV